MKATKMKFVLAALTVIIGYSTSNHATAEASHDPTPLLMQVRICRQVAVESGSRSMFRNVKAVSGYGIEEVVGSRDHELVVLLVTQRGQTVKEIPVANSLTKDECIKATTSCEE